ncbi:MAG: hypothetical protein ABJP45_19430, partial [Cyclobacteriaceae bacterium]
MMRKNSYITIVAVLLSFSVKAQYGIEWIDFNQSYYKLQIASTDFYRVTQAELTAAGFPAASVPASRVQLFRKGSEVAINVNANQDGTLNYLEFFGEAISGVEDSPLYELGDQPHSLYNLFSDTAAYFLTYKLGAESGKRIAFSSDQDASGLTAEPFHYEETSILYTSDYATGIRFGTKSAFSLSKYDLGEGWTGALQGKGVFTDHDFVLTNRVAGEVPICDFVLSGRNSLAHNAAVSAGPSTSSLTSIGSTQFTGWGSTGDSFSISETSIGGAGELTLRVLTEGFDGATDFLSVAYMRVRYAQDLVAPPTENSIFTLGDPSDTKAYLQISATTPSAVSIYDIEDPTTLLRIATANFSDRVDAVIPNPISGHKVLAVTNPSSVPLIKQVSLVQPSLTGKDYLIITHPSLRASGDPVMDVKNYRESSVGGNHSVLITEIQELF